ncbi:hypothetical protein C9374_011507 [Naegleria lovaniensis]|uniref:OTU domain-containing protein n=1 Tax=Naegleria lovaniensis TaxID=51637 RepID=A0AA88KQY7_NAELO|nr:uncharacterized protein C9374_011507 [Naegleria lovaniensis]KAG2392782.1 hypothetical protein C9374_011507 [Naegleria lovaniensis]
MTAQSEYRGKYLQDHFKIISSPSDGNCLFHSIATGLNQNSSSSNKSSSNHLQVRKEIVNWIKNNLETKVDGLEFKLAIFLNEGETVSDYLKALEKEGSYGDFCNIVAMSRVRPGTQFKIFLVEGSSSSGKKIIKAEIEVNPEDGVAVTSDICLAYDEQKQHYDLLIPTH